jgi:hypothetical protein
MTVHDDHASYLTAVKALSTRAGGARSRSHRPREPRLCQIVGVKGGNGVSKAMPATSFDAIAGANLP